MFKITIKVENDQVLQDILDVLQEAEENGDIIDSFGVQVEEVLNEKDH